MDSTNVTDFLQKLNEINNNKEAPINITTVLSFIIIGLSLTKFILVEFRKKQNKKKFEKINENNNLIIHNKLDNILNKEVGSVQNLLTKNNNELQKINLQF